MVFLFHPDMAHLCFFYIDVQTYTGNIALAFCVELRLCYSLLIKHLLHPTRMPEAPE